MARPGVEPLSPGEAQEIFQAGSVGTLIGGMALSVWAQTFGIEPETNAAAGVTTDIDFLGTPTEANEFAERLDRALQNPIEIYTAPPDDPTPNSAKILVKNFHGREEPIEIDYLRTIHGFDPHNQERLQFRALEVTIDGANLTVMHPLDCLKSRMLNLFSLYGKQGPESIAQCFLATGVVRAYLTSLCAEVPQPLREILKAIEQVVDLAVSRGGRHVFVAHGIDLLSTVPADQVECQKFQDIRWPQIVDHVSNRRNALA